MMNVSPPGPAAASGRGGDLGARLLSTVAHLVTELRSGEAPAAVTLDSRLERDLGLDSLARVELITRVERLFGLELPDEVLGNAESVRDLLQALSAAGPSLPGQPADRDRVELRAGEGGRAGAPFPHGAGTLSEVLDWHLQRHAPQTHIVLLGSDDEPESIAYDALDAGARRIASGLRQHDVQPGQSVAIMLPTSRAYFETFFGIVLAGAVPVPIYPPARMSQIEDHFRRHAGILNNAQARMLVTVPEAKALARLLTARVDTLSDVATPAELAAAAPAALAGDARPADLAFLQYTSGSTGNPKGVMLTHANLLANLRAMGEAVHVTAQEVFVSWLPLYHDMGLIGAWFSSLYYGFPLVVMSPLAFLARPQRWLWAIHRYRGTFSGGPNFAYELCLRRIDDADIEGLDLSSWRWAFNGAEPVSAQTLQAFTARFARYGFRREAAAPVYGLAEASVGLALTPPGQGVRLDRIERDTFARHGQAVPVPDREAPALEVVACGRVIPGHELRVVNADGAPLPERREGRLQFRGPSATGGYIRRPQENAGLFDGDWLNTGDLAYLADGQLYLTGRTKDLIIRGGRNLYPYELEASVGAIEGIRRGCVAAFASTDPAAGTERLVVLAETRATEAAQREKLRAAINEVAVDLLGLPPDDVVLAAPHTVLKTSSGKIRRAACRELYEGGMKTAAPRAVWWQLVRLALQGAGPRLRQGLRAAAATAWGLYAAAVFWLVAPLTWLAAVLLPRPDWSWAAGRLGARALLRLTGTPFQVKGVEHLAQAGPCILVANHSSYLDGVVLVAALPRRFGFVAKRELAQQFIAGRFLRHLGAEFVERFDVARGAEDAERLTVLARGGRSLAYFPEGTFTETPGLRSFHLGAFVAAVQAGIPVLPVAIRGTRSVLRDTARLPSRRAIEVRIGAPLAPQGAGWPAAVALRDSARAAILRECGEPDRS